MSNRVEYEENTVIVSMSGAMDVQMFDNMTPEMLFEMVKNKWGIDLDRTDEPFVVVHDQIRDSYRVVENDESIGDVDNSREVVRVVLPLK